MRNLISPVPSAYLKFVFDRLAHKRETKRHLLSQGMRQSKLIQQERIHNDLILRHGPAPLLKRDKQILQFTVLGQIAQLPLTLQDIIHYAQGNRVAAFLYHRIRYDLFILFPGRPLKPYMVLSAHLPHGTLLCRLHGAACQRKHHGKKDSGQNNRQNRKDIPHPVIPQAAVR